MSNQLKEISHSDLKAFTSYRKHDGSWYVIIDLQHAWDGDVPTDRVEKVCLMNVQTEFKDFIAVDDFISYVSDGILRKVNQ